MQLKNIWIKPTILLCANGFLRSLNPSEPYLTPYLMGPNKNLTATNLINQIYPVWTYSYMAFLIPVFLLTDWMKYKPVIIFEGLSLVGCWLLLIFGDDILQMQIMQVLYGMATAAEIGYYSYIYSIVPETRYLQVTSYTRSVVLFGLFLGAVLAQILVSVAQINYLYLFVIALANIFAAFLISFFLPLPTETLFFYHKPDKEEQKVLNAEASHIECDSNTTSNSIAVKKVTEASKSKILLLSLLTDLKTCYSNFTLMRWSVWWALSTCGWMLVVNYIQNLWENISPSATNETRVYNGAVESVATIMGALGAFSVSYIQTNLSKWGEILLGCSSVFKCGLLLLMYWTTSIWACYAAYVAYILLYNFVITITQYQLAVGLNTRRFALLFGANTFMAVSLNTLLTVIIIDQAGFGLDVETQFLIYSVYFGILAFIFLLHGSYDRLLSKRTKPAEVNQDDNAQNVD